MHTNKLLGLVVVVGGVLGSLMIVSQISVGYGECITVSLPGNTGVERCKEKSNITTQQASDLKDLVTKSNDKLKKIQNALDSSSSGSDSKEEFAELDEKLEQIQKQNQEISEYIPYLQQEDYRKFALHQSELIENLETEINSKESEIKSVQKWTSVITSLEKIE